MVIKTLVKRRKTAGGWLSSGIFFFILASCLFQAQASDVSLASIWKLGRGPEPALSGLDALSYSVHSLFFFPKRNIIPVAMSLTL